MDESGSMILEEEIDEEYEPTDEGMDNIRYLDLIEYGVYLGMDPIKDREYLWIAKEGLKSPLP